MRQVQNEKNKRLNHQLNILRELGYDFDSHAMILDLGCGNGELVEEYRKNGYQAFGCDLKFTKAVYVDSMKERDIIRLVNTNPYRIPFDDNTFDLIISDQVFEHVQDYSSVLSEIRRVLKPNSASLHMFPSRYRLIETHSLVPLASIIQEYNWLFIWACLGIRNQHQKGISNKETAKRNHIYLHNRTNYLTKREIRKNIAKYFSNVVFCENLFLKFSRRGRLIYQLSLVFPFIPLLYSCFHNRTVFFS